ncbi:MAG: hypothetical protein WCR07_14645 [Verrucomicrobiota bacterium]
MSSPCGFARSLTVAPLAGAPGCSALVEAPALAWDICQPSSAPRSLLVLQKNLRRHHLPPNSIVTAKDPRHRLHGRTNADPGTSAGNVLLNLDLVIQRG